MLRMLFLEGSRRLGKNRENGKGREQQRLGEQEAPEDWLLLRSLHPAGSAPWESQKAPTFSFLLGLRADTVSGLYFSRSGL